MRFFGNVFAWLVAVLVTYVAGSVFSTQFVLAGLGVDIPLGDRVSASVSDIASFYLFGVVVAVALAIGFIVASLVKAVIPVLAPVAYPVAGAAAVLALIGIIAAYFGQMPIGGARTELGLAFQGLAGLIGGLAFELLRPKN